MAWPMGTRRNFRRVGASQKKPPHRKKAPNKVKKLQKSPHIAKTSLHK